MAVSLALHAGALALLLATRRPEPPLPVAPSYDLIFENGGSSTPPTAPDVALDQPSEAPADDLPPTPPVIEPPAPPLSVPTPPDIEPPEASEPEPEPPEPTPPEPAPPEPIAPPQPEAALPPSPAPTVAEPTPEPAPPPEPAPTATQAPQLPTVRLGEPDAPPQALPPQALVPDFPELLPPPPLPPAPPQPRPRAQAQRTPAPGAFPPPIDLNYGPAAARPPAPRVAGSSRAIDLSLGAPKPGPNKSEAFFDIRAANIGADWAQGLAAYWRRHRYYPPQAAENGEDGTVQIDIVVNRQGRVISAEVHQRSGSTWLDMAAIGTWRNAQLAPLPAENTDPTITIPLTINYVLIRR